jgi:hypothetical protein
MINLKDLFGSLLIITSIFDAWKYLWSSSAIRKIGLARGHSRKFLNAAICNDLIKLIYGICILDVFIILSSILALVTMGYNFYTLYLFYPYKCRGLDGFKRPNIFFYVLNSFQPNRIRKRL